mmetsp:Transcript_32023/g.49002  ORF Transcript_32023/g.49002 Transcript_32023/m.49002 type:complete len:114 (-) Transcript_32023:20-361(-)
MVITCFDELAEQKGIVPMRGDLISNLDEDEGATILATLMDFYLQESMFETVRSFNWDADNFKYQGFIMDSLLNFSKRKRHIIETKAPQIDLGKVKKYGHKTDEELGLVPGILR